MKPPARRGRTYPCLPNRAIVEDVKAGAEVWLESQGGTGHPVLMASQRYGNGVASVICMQNLWRWRLARTSDPRHYDRFWRQLFRFLADAGRNAVTLNIVDTSPAPGDEVELLIEQPTASGRGTASDSNPTVVNEARLTIIGPDQSEVLNILVNLDPERLTATRFMANESGMYSVKSSAQRWHLAGKSRHSGQGDRSRIGSDVP